MQPSQQSPQAATARPEQRSPRPRRRAEDRRPPLAAVIEDVAGAPAPRALLLLLDELDPRA